MIKLNSARSRALFAAAAVSGAVLLATPASAAITITPGAGSLQPAENVLAVGSQTGPTVGGVTNQTSTAVSFTSLNTELLSNADSNGQAKINTPDGSLDTARIFLTNGGTFTQAEFNLFNAVGSTSSVTFTINGILQPGTYALSNGQNFFDFLATGFDRFSSISFDTNGTGVVDLRQVRLGGIQAASAVPEPATWALMLLGFGGMGVAMRRRRSATALQQMA